MPKIERLPDCCGYCGVCIAVCPQKCLKLSDNILVINEGCENCGYCLQVCPLGAIKKEAPE
ncbi:MAG: 4Fe-4S binding protein [Euryarchaeota archaeon]|nr:4Fe-4S binding protein [Euryarchaeota archaeon]HNS25679.1 4Fe-4S binding protein [Methanobacteriaceae archaeon]